MDGIMKIGFALIAVFCLLANEHLFPVHTQDSLPGPTELRNLASDLLRAEATAESDQARSDTIIKLCDLFAVIRLHPAHDQSPMLRADEALTRRRLITTSQELRKQLRPPECDSPRGFVQPRRPSVSRNDK